VAAIVYFALSQFFKISKIQFALIVIPLAVIVEYVQYRYNSSASVTDRVILRDTISLILIVIGVYAVGYFTKSFSPGAEVLALLTFLAVIFVVDLSFGSAHGHQPLYKHSIDVASYAIGPFIVYPLISGYL